MEPVRARQAGSMPTLLDAVQQHMPGVLPLSAYALGKPAIQGLCMGYGCVEVAQIVKAVRAAGRAVERAVP